MTVKRLLPEDSAARDRRMLAATDHEVLEAVEVLLRERPIPARLRAVLDRRDEARRRLRSGAGAGAAGA